MAGIASTASPNTGGDFGELVVGSSIKPEPVEWIWPGRIPKAQFSFLVGVPGCGKSCVTWDIAARYTTGRDWPDAEATGPGRVLLISHEDDAATRIMPKLQLYSADTERCIFMQEPGRFRLDTGSEWLEKQIRATGSGLVVIDPLNDFLGAANPNDSADVRKMTSALTTVARRTKAAILIVAHLNKNENASDINRVAGSIDLIGAPRTSLIVTTHPDDPKSRILSKFKWNMHSPTPGPIAFAEDADGSLTWTVLPEDFATAPVLKGVTKKAVKFLETVYAEAGRDEVPSQVIQVQAKEAGISRYALDHASEYLGLEPKHYGNQQSGYWTWRKPDTVQQ